MKKVVLILLVIAISINLTACRSIAIVFLPVVRLAEYTKSEITPDADEDLEEALRNKNFEAVKEAVENGADVNGTTLTKNPIAYAVGTGQLEVAQYLIDNGADIHDTVNMRGTTVLMECAEQMEYKACMFLIDAGVDVLAEDNNGKTALEYLLGGRMGSGDEEVIGLIYDLLVENGCSVKPESLNGIFELWCDEKVCISRKVLEMLIDEGHEVNISCDLYYAILGEDEKLRELLSEGLGTEERGKIISFVLAYGEGETLRVLKEQQGENYEYSEDTYIYYFERAGRYGNISIAEFLKDEDAYIGSQDKSYAMSNSLYTSVLWEQSDMAKYLISEGTPCEYESRRGGTYPKYVLDIAILTNNDEIINSLFDLGYPLNDESLESAFHSAIRANSFDLIDYFMQQGYDIEDDQEAMNVCASNCDIDMAEYLVDLGATAHGSVSLYSCIEAEKYHMVEFFIEHGADVNISEDGSRYREPLAEAIDKGNYKIIKLLIDNGAVVDGEHLYDAAYLDNQEILKFILDSGVDVNYKNINEETALMHAARHGRIENLKLLIEYGADVSLKNKFKESAIDMAEEYEEYEAVEYLKAIS